MTITVSSWFLNKFMLVDQLCSAALLNQAANWLWHPAKMFQPHAPHAPAQKSLPATESWHFTSFKLASQAQFHFMDRATVRLHLHTRQSYCPTYQASVFSWDLQTSRVLIWCHLILCNLYKLPSNQNWPVVRKVHLNNCCRVHPDMFRCSQRQN